MTASYLCESKNDLDDETTASSIIACGEIGGKFYHISRSCRHRGLVLHVNEYTCVVSWLDVESRIIDDWDFESLEEVNNIFDCIIILLRHFMIICIKEGVMFVHISSQRKRIPFYFEDALRKYGFAITESGGTMEGHISLIS